MKNMHILKNSVFGYKGDAFNQKFSHAAKDVKFNRPEYLLTGKSVKLGEMGTLHISFSSEGVENADEFNISMITGVRVLFTSSPELRRAIETIRFEKSE